MPVIAILLHDLELGGTERVAIRLGNAWSRAGCRVVLYVGHARGPQRALVAGGVVIRAAEPPVRRSRFSRQRLARWFARRCALDGIDVAFLPGNFYFIAAPAVHAATRGAVPVFAKISNTLWRPDRHALRNRFFAFLTRRRLRHAAAVVAMSPALLREARGVLGHGIRVVEVPNPVLDSLPDPGAPRRADHLCAVGRLVPQKNFAHLLRAFALLGDLPLTLDVIGDGGQRAGLQRLARDLGIADRLHFTGEVDDVPRRLAAAGLLVLSSDFEGYPGVIVEALAAGTFVVARDCSPAIRELLPDRGIGLVVEGDDPRDLARAIRESLADGHRDLARMRAIATAHLADEVAHRYLELFEAAHATAQ